MQTLHFPGRLILKWVRSEYTLLIIVLLITAFAYYPALNSRFLLDDFYNLSQLEDIADTGYINFIFSGFAGPSGRPVSMLSFALQYEHWPHDRYAFKLVNLIVHLFNGVLIYLITRLLFIYTNLNKGHVVTFSLLLTAIWLLHPIHISAVLYTIQRMTLLSAFFSLAGIWAYLKLRLDDFKELTTFKTFFWTGLFCLSFLLSVFSKENGVLLPILILTIEFTLLNEITRHRIWKIWAGIFLFMPCVLIIAYLANGFESMLAGYQTRPYTMSERLLTESRIIFEYIYSIILPHPSLFGLYHDDYRFSTGLFNPVTTFISVIGIFLMIMLGIAGRKKMKVLAFAVLWFLGAHLLESTYLNLELYFEHRNYLAAYSILFLVVWVCFKIFGYIRNKALAIPVVATIIIPTVVVSLIEIDLWSKPVEQSIEWQRRSPDSQRAREDLGNLYFSNSDSKMALQVYQEMMLDFPDDVYPYIKVLNIKGCLQKTDIPDEDWKAVFAKAAEAKWQGNAAIAELDAIIGNLQKGKCNNINAYLLIRLAVTLAHNPEFSRYYGLLFELAAILSAFIGEYETALNNLNRAIQERPTPPKYIMKVKILRGLGRLDEAREALNDFREYLKTSNRAYIANKQILLDLEEMLEEKNILDKGY